MNQIRRACGGWDEKIYEEAVAGWAGKLSETWERIFSQEIIGPVAGGEGGLEVRPKMVKVLALFSDVDHREFDASYSRVSQWAKRHETKVLLSTTSPPDVAELETELDLVDTWFKRVKGYKV